MSGKLDNISLSTITKWIITILIVFIIGYVLWYFKFLVFCIFIALIFSIVGRPLMVLLNKLHFKKIKLNKAICAGLTLLVEILVIGLLFYFLVPLIIGQAQKFSDIDVYALSKYYQGPSERLTLMLQKYNLLALDTNVNEFLTSKAYSLFNTIRLPQVANSILSLAGNIIMGFFVTAFITFFFLKDSHMLTRFIDNITPDKYLVEVHNIINNSRKLITRYFLGVFCEILTMIILLGLGFWIAGFESSILIACLCGIMVILPYIGVIIGGGIGFMVMITSCLSSNPDAPILQYSIVYVCIFVGVKLLDDFILQPLIYSKSVNAKPLEIFLIILMAGQLGGIWGMVFAIPFYTFFRIIAKEFFSKWKFIKLITKNIE